MSSSLAAEPSRSKPPPEIAKGTELRIGWLYIIMVAIIEVRVPGSGLKVQSVLGFGTISS